MSNPAIKRLFRREAVAAARLTHSNIVSVFDTGEHNGAPFIVMEYLGGGSLRDRLSTGALPPEVVAQIGADACAALGHAHKMGIVHGNIRPENVLFTEAGHLKVSDFAIAKASLADPALTDPAGTYSSSHYAAPELAGGAEPDIRADLYSVGVILYESLLGMTPVAAARAAAGGVASEGRSPTPGPKDLRPETPEDLDLAIIGALQLNPTGRYQTARALERTLRPLAGGRPAAVPATQAPRRVKATPPPDTSDGRTQLSDISPPPAQPAPLPAAPPPDEERSVARSGESFLRTEGRWLIPTVLVIAAAAGIVLSIPSVRTGISNVVGPQTQQQQRRLEVSRAMAYDPPPGDGEETTRRLGLAVDGDRQTSWATSSYSRADLGGLKDGVGIYFDLGDPEELSGIKVTSVAGGWQGTVRYSDNGERWSDPGSSITAGAEQTFKTSGSHRYWMIWITKLVVTPGEGSGSNAFSVAIREIEPLAG